MIMRPGSHIVITHHYKPTKTKSGSNTSVIVYSNSPATLPVKPTQQWKLNVHCKLFKKLLLHMVHRHFIPGHTRSSNV